MQEWQTRAKRQIQQGSVMEAMRIAGTEGASSACSAAELNRLCAENHNRTVGSLTGYDCPECLNRGEFMIVDDAGYVYTRLCKCRNIRNALDNIRRSGLARSIETMTFDGFAIETDWQKNALRTARAYAKAVAGGGKHWLFFAGQPGCGKTHLCTAACGELLRSGKVVRYVVWAEIVDRIKANRFDDGAMESLFEPLKSVDVLYIDDLFKSAYRIKADSRGNAHPPRPMPTDADVNVCYQILNARYLRDLPTILSCEWYLLDDLMGVDEATFSRVYERSKGFMCEIARDNGRNYRMAGGAG